MSDSGKKDGDPDSTEIGGLPPRAPHPPAPPASPQGDDSTGITPIARPPVPKREENAPAPPALPSEPSKAEPPTQPVEETMSRPVAPPKAPPVEAQPAAVEEIESEEGTRLFKREPVTLTRLAPREHFGLIPLEDRTYRLGRSSSCDIPLFSAEASRDHARLRKEPGGWVIEAQPGKVVLVNGASAQGPVKLGQKARLRMGEDDLLFIDESAPANTAPPVGTEVGSATDHKAGRWRRWAMIAAAILLATVVAGLLLSR